MPGQPDDALDVARRLAASLSRLSERTPALVASAREALDRASARADEEATASESEAREEFLNASRRDERSAATARRSLVKEHESKIAAATRTAEAEISAFLGRTKELAEQSLRDTEEREWIADTMAESAETKADQELAAARTMVAARTKALADAVESMRLALRSHGLPPPDPEQADAPAADLEAIFTRATAQAHSLRRRLDSSINSIPLALACGLSAGLLALVGLVIAGRTWPEGVLPLAGGLAGTVTALMLIARAVVRGTVPGLARRLARSQGELASSGAAIIRAAEEACTQQKAAAQAKRDRELARAEQRRTRRKEEIQERETVLLPRLRAANDHAINQLVRARDAALSAHDEQAAEAAASHRRTLDARLREVAARRDTALAAARAEYDLALADLRAEWSNLARTVASSAHEARAHRDALAPAWTLPQWDAFPPALTLPRHVHLGLVTLAPSPDLRPDTLPADVAPLIPPPADYPIALDLQGRASLLALHTPDRRTQALRLLNLAMLRLLSSIPPGKVRFTILDPVGLGQSFAAFMHLADAEPLLVNDRIWTDPRHIEQKLTDLTEHMEHVIQKYLRNQYASIQAYNDAAGEVAEPLRFLVMADFPTNLTENAARRLASILEAGPRCGVYTLLAADLKTKGAAHCPLAEVERHSLTITLDAAPHVNDSALARSIFTPDALPDDARLTAVLERAGSLAKDAARVQVPFDAAAPEPSAQWSLSAADELAVPIGRVGATKLQRFVLGRGTAQHALVAGRTGSGKSTLFHVLITNLALWYAPAEVEFFLIDFKKGVEFKPYATHRLPHARVIAVESEREFGLSVLRGLDAELTRRGVLFRDAGAQDLAAYRAAATASGGRLPMPMPRVLLVVDEFQEFFVDDDKIAQEAALLLDRLVRQGRAFGMHVVLGSQTLGGAFGIARSTIGQMGVRIALQSSEQDSYLIMSEDNTAPRLLTRPGEAIYNDASGLVEGNSPFQVVWLPEDRREQELTAVRARAQAAGLALPPPIVFEGNAPADVHANHALRDTLKHPAPVPVPRAWLGEAISIKDPTTATFPRRGGANVLTVGLDDAPAASLHALAMLALAAQCDATPAPSIILINGAPEDAGAVLDLAAQALGPRAVRHGPRDAADAVTRLAQEVDRRAALPHDQADAAPRIFLVVHALHRLRDLRRADDFSFSRDAASPADRFAAILREGPALGVHVLTWCESVTALERSVDRQTLREFGQRVIFQMSAADSTHLIDSPAAANLGRNRALYFSDETASMEKFRPYAAPPEAWHRHAAAPARAAAPSSPAGDRPA